MPLARREKCAVPNKELFGPIVRHMSLSKTLMYVYVCMYVCMYSLYIHYMYMYICMHVCMYICIYIIYFGMLCVNTDVCTCVYVFMSIYVLGGKGKLAEPLRQVVHNSNTNSVNFQSCHRNEDSDSPLIFSQTTRYFAYGSELSRLVKQ